jgi:hypothetical protein
VSWRCRVAALEARVARHPYRDSSRGLLTRSAPSSSYRSLLIEELGTEPSPDVVRIERRVATGSDGIETDTCELFSLWRGRFLLRRSLVHRCEDHLEKLLEIGGWFGDGFP